MTGDELLAEQQAYYRRRAPTYDDWWLRRGRYAGGGDEARAAWDAEVAVVEAALSAFGATGDVVELAGGTGWWTQRLAATADLLTVIDGSFEVLAINRRRVGRDDVEWLEADLFSWEPTRSHDVVFFSFWLSHVPRSRFAAFWAMVGRALAPGGRVFLIDNRHDPTREAADPYLRSTDGDVQLRSLDDGSEHRVVKVFDEPAALERRLAGLGWSANMHATPRFVYGEAHRLSGR